MPALGRVTAVVDQLHPTAASVLEQELELEAFWLLCPPHLYIPTT